MRNHRLGYIFEREEGAITASLSFVRLPHLNDPSQALLIAGAVPSGEVKVHLYSERELRERLSDLAGGEELRVFDFGRSAEHFSPSPSCARVLREGGQKDDDIQTEAEAQLARSAEMLDKVKSIFRNDGLGTCPAGWVPKTEITHWPIETANGGIRNVPFVITVYTCHFGNTDVVQTTMPIDDPALKTAPKAIRVCSTHFRFEDVRKVAFTHTVKSTKIGLGFSLGFNASGSFVATGPKIGDKVFEGGQEKIDASTGKTVTFNFSLVKQHAKLKFDAWQRLVADVGPDMFVCREG